MESLKDLMSVCDSNVVPESLGKRLPNLAEKDWRVVAIELAGWMTRQKRLGHERPMTLRTDHVWAGNLRLLLDACDDLQAIFEISGDKFRFKESVDAAVRSEIRDFVTSKYQPVLRT